MIDDRDLTRAIDAWLDVGPTEMPDRVVDVVAARIAVQRQRRAWRLLDRRLPMSAPFRVAAAAVALLAVLIGGMIVIGGGGGLPTPTPTARPSGTNGGVTAPTPSPATSVTPSPTPTPAWNRYPVCGSGDPPCAGPVGPGTYTSQGFSVPVTYTLTTPWVNVSDWSDYFILYPDTPANRALASVDGAGPHPYILVSPWTAVSPSDGCPDAERSVDATRVDANGFVAYMESRDGLSVSATPATMNGLSGQQLDVTVEPAWSGCLPHIYSDSDQARYIVLDLPSGESLVITLWGPDRDRFLAEAMPVVESFEFDLSQLPSPSPS